jgi:hypothetical protein
VLNPYLQHLTLEMYNSSFLLLMIRFYKLSHAACVSISSVGGGGGTGPQGQGLSINDRVFGQLISDKEQHIN